MNLARGATRGGASLQKNGGVPQCWKHKSANEIHRRWLRAGSGRVLAAAGGLVIPPRLNEEPMACEADTRARGLGSPVQTAALTLLSQPRWRRYANFHR